MIISCKEQSTECYALGKFGTHLRQWDSLESLDEDGFIYPIVVRYRHPFGGGGPCYYHKHRNEIPNIVETIIKLEWNPKYIYFNEGAPDHNAIFQGELYERGDGNWILFYNTVATQMRYALADKGARHIYDRVTILYLFRKYFTESSYEDFMSLMEHHPNHCIEFTAYNQFIGHLKGRNTIVWDARSY